MTSIVETIQEIVRAELRTVRVAELGVVDAVNPHSDENDDDNYNCDVRLKNTGLLLRRVPIATTHIGSVAVPNVGDLVLLTFTKGDINQPILLSRLFTDDDRPPLSRPNEMIMHLPLHASDERAIRTAVRNSDANDPPREMVLNLDPKITVRVTDHTVRATAGNCEMTLDQPEGGSGTVTVLAGGTRITMNQDGDVSVEALGDLSLRAHGAMELQAGTSLTLKAGAGVELQAGTSLALEAAAEATLEASASVTVQGTVISINGLTSFGAG
ncbi:phage baseplate assembly protein V [Caballeronia novacaledonica]|uniref:Gp5/Type VI secretion system Vgr protein OB-fold domain-containing protein n=1 Tax=Caballeronia novacaledonica TaxID=1544861 RepID=A0AA37IGP7_9BURK|nr:phage baseplate assembly protein V [Caballeronia novacaledonica]GJH28939.1 hypothetical protein CBA19CS42_30505 [Caballeronia novacaledonica]